nr:uncharacterized protein LOC125181428 isoform X2 [Anser cygnoides]
MGGSCRAGPGSARARPPRRGAATRAEAAPRRKDPCGVCCRAKVAHWLNGGKLQLACCSRRFPRRKSSPSVQAPGHNRGPTPVTPSVLPCALSTHHGEPRPAPEQPIGTTPVTPGPSPVTPGGPPCAP